MPMYLKRDTIRLLEASVESISLAVAALGLPRRYESREPASENSIAIGLAGVSAELAMSAIIVQAKGEQALRFPSNFYKTGSHIVDDFRLLITSQIPKMVFLTQNVRNPADHISKILELSSKFKLLTKSRAGGLHAGKGPSRDVCIACVNNVIDFINLLGQSSRIKPYTESVPRTIDMPKSYDLIIDDLVRKLNQSSSNEDKAIAITVPNTKRSAMAPRPTVPKRWMPWSASSSGIFCKRPELSASTISSAIRSAQRHLICSSRSAKPSWSFPRSTLSRGAGRD